MVMTAKATNADENKMNSEMCVATAQLSVKTQQMNEVKDFYSRFFLATLQCSKKNIVDSMMLML